MAEGKDPNESKAANNEFAALNGHVTDNDQATGSSDFAASILGQPTTILIVTNVDDATFVSNDIKVTVLALFSFGSCQALLSPYQFTTSTCYFLVTG